jgi:hypothetical protein
MRRSLRETVRETRRRGGQNESEAPAPTGRELALVQQRWADRNGIRQVCVQVMATLFQEHDGLGGGSIPLDTYDALPDRVKTSKALAARRKQQAAAAQAAEDEAWEASCRPPPPKQKWEKEGRLLQQQPTGGKVDANRNKWSG